MRGSELRSSSSGRRYNGRVRLCKFNTLRAAESMVSVRHPFSGAQNPSRKITAGDCGEQQRQQQHCYCAAVEAGTLLKTSRCLETLISQQQVTPFPHLGLGDVGVENTVNIEIRSKFYVTITSSYSCHLH